MSNLAAYFEEAGWPAEQIEPDVWRCAFADEAGATYTLYALAAGEWVHLAVSPLLRVSWEAGGERLLPALLRLNQEVRLARLALDEDGDINLLADLPTAHVSARFFAETLELLAFYTDRLAPELRGLAAGLPD